MVDEYGEKALRVILFAVRDFSTEAECMQAEDDVVNKLVLQMIVGIQVPWSRALIIY